MKTKLLIALSITLLTLFSVPIVKAQEVNITGNAAETENAVSITQSTQTETSQTNNAEITNNINTNTNTGGNSANNNTGGQTHITTGDAVQISEITNQINNSITDNSCCPTPSPATSVNISDNGQGSENKTSLQVSGQTTISVTQNATITNNIQQTANTGGNTANNNNGDVKIKTGDIISNLTITNKLNYSKVSTQANADNENNNITIQKNGSSSKSDLKIKKDNETNITQQNNAHIKNDIKSIFDTGHNKAIANAGKTDIKTGNILALTKIENEANKSIVKLICCDKDVEKPKPQPITAPPTQPSPSPTVTQSSSPSQPPTQEGQVAGVTAHVLPITGNNWIFFSLLGNIIMLFLGSYLRLRSGNSPGTN